MFARDFPISGHPRHRVVRSLIVSVLATTALLLGLFAANSAAAEHEMAVVAQAASVSVEHLTGTNESVASAGVDVAVSSAFDGGWLTFGNDFMVGCGILAITCSVLLTVAAFIRLARQPSESGRLLDVAGFVVKSFRRVSLRAHQPSLTLLSISRV